MRVFDGLLLAGCWGVALAQPFYLPTPNQALFERGGAARYFAPTDVGDWTAGLYGCSRSHGTQFHEGIDILHTQTDRRGEPTDPVFATAAGRVAYVNPKASLSNYGIYLVLEHHISGLTVYSFYAHLSEVAPGIRPGRVVQAGERIGTMGRTANTRTPIRRERAHLHFEIALRLSDHFDAWHRQRMRGTRNDHGEFNGRNFLGLDPIGIFQEQALRGRDFDLADWIRRHPSLCRVWVRATDLDYLHRAAPLLDRNPEAERQGVAGYELTLDFAGVPCRVRPLAPGEVPRNKGRWGVTQVNPQELQRHGCRDLVAGRPGHWRLLPAGERLLDLLTY